MQFRFEWINQKIKIMLLHRSWMGLVGPIIGIVILIDGISKARGFPIVLGLAIIGYGVFIYKITKYPWDKK